MSSNAPGGRWQVNYADCKLSGGADDHLDFISVEYDGALPNRIAWIRNDGLKIEPQETTFKMLIELLPDAVVDREPDVNGDWCVEAGGLTWAFPTKESTCNGVAFLVSSGSVAEPEWKVLNTNNGLKLSFPCTLNDALAVLGKDCAVTDHRGRKVKLPD